MTILRTASTDELAPDLAAALRGLLDDAFEGRFTDHDWDHGLGGTHVVAIDGDRPVGHASVVPRPIEVGGQQIAAGHVEAVGVDPGRQGTGIGTEVMNRIDGIIRQSYDLGVLATGGHHFYERLGWERWQGRTHVRTAAGPVRSPDDDDGVMVLRFGRSTTIDLMADISCDERAGDDW